MSDDYPHWRTALFGNGHAANLYCACKYAVWHLFHLMFIVLGAVLLAGLVPAMLAYRGLRFGFIRVSRAVSPAVSEGAGQGVARRGRAVASDIRTAPVTRRIYGECPVDIKLDPKWFGRLAGYGKTLVDYVEPPTMVWVCECDEPRAWNHEPPRGCIRCGSSYRNVPEDSIGGGGGDE